MEYLKGKNLDKLVLLGELTAGARVAWGDGVLGDLVSGILANNHIVNDGHFIYQVLLSKFVLIEWIILSYG